MAARQRALTAQQVCLLLEEDSELDHDLSDIEVEVNTLL